MDADDIKRKELYEGIEKRVRETLEPWHDLDDFNDLEGVISNLIFNIIDEVKLEK